VASRLDQNRWAAPQPTAAVMNGILSRNAALRSAVAPHGVFNCKVKLRRGCLALEMRTTREPEGRGYTRWGSAQRDAKNRRGNRSRTVNAFQNFEALGCAHHVTTLKRS
jgi:hypothetical protein